MLQIYMYHSSAGVCTLNRRAGFGAALAEVTSPVAPARALARQTESPYHD